jgi:hypothetical protein
MVSTFESLAASVMGFFAVVLTTSKQIPEWFVRVQLKRDGTRWRREGKWRGNWRMEWVASTLHTTSEHGVSSITPADAHTSAASSRLNWRPRRFKWTRPFRRKKSRFCPCAIAFQPQSTMFHQLLAHSQLSYTLLFYRHELAGAWLRKLKSKASDRFTE